MSACPEASANYSKIEGWLADDRGGFVQKGKLAQIVLDRYGKMADFGQRMKRLALPVQKPVQRAGLKVPGPTRQSSTFRIRWLVDVPGLIGYWNSGKCDAIEGTLSPLYRKKALSCDSRRPAP